MSLSDGNLALLGRWLAIDYCFRLWLLVIGQRLLSTLSTGYCNWLLVGASHRRTVNRGSDGDGAPQTEREVRISPTPANLPLRPIATRG
ncbi:hypothetical protein FIBSPDRAFT_854711 [Athelia psychrophila]|uniref:Uncharacterized protein n=1 Tax=Athelia psychrophila TaxID=1759441 RepID=A0A166Q173_9AGAM|nr:hypothetical protein FIBSPDRAFT_854711 [Fibularhizoctonia sp. CBS 109695]